MSTFRPIQPAVPGRGASGSDLPAGSDPPVQPSKRKGRGRGTAQACDDCRRTKIKCDGQRPICSPCIVKNRPCGYVGAEGQTRAAAAKARLESLERLAAALRDGPPDQASSILQRIRSADGILEVTDSPTSSSHARSDPPARLGESAMLQPRAGDAMVIDTSSPAVPLPSAVSDARSAGGPEAASERPDEMQPSVIVESSSRQATLSAAPPPTTQSPVLIQVTLPNASITEHALESFFNCSGKLFHVFSRGEMLRCYRSVFNAAHGALTANLKASAGCLMAAASVGAQYMPDTFSRRVESGFYDLAKHFFEDVVEHRPLDAIKVCALLAQYNILGKATVSLAYVEIGLGMSRMHGLGNMALRPRSMPNPVWVDLHKTWRTLVFFSSWLSSTLGYISGNHIVSEREILSEMRVEGSDDIAEIVQTEMAKICLIKAEILRMHLGFRGLTAQTMTSITNDLHTWYWDLPEAMRIEATSQGGLAVATKRSILHVHLLYLGAMMLMYRIAASQFVRSFATGTPSAASQTPLRGLVAEQGAEAVLAANTSARILQLLLEDDGIFKRCWLVIFQAYTACTVLLHAAVQKRLHGFDSSTWAEDMAHAEDCLAVLAFCGSGDRIALKFHSQLTAIHDEILATGEVTMEASGSRQGVIHSNAGPTSEDAGQLPDEAQEKGKRPLGPTSGHYLLHVPKNTNESHLKLTLSLLLMLSQPFGDPPVRPSAEDGGAKRSWLGDPLRHEYPQNVERSDSDVESSVSFQWDLSKFDLSATAAEQVADAIAASGPRDDASPSFVGSDEPSGWASSSHMTKGGEGS